MRDHAHKHLDQYRRLLREDCDDSLQDLYPPEEFLPDSVIDTLLDQCYSLPDIASLRKLLHGDAILEPHLSSLQAVMDELRAHFDVVRTEARASKAAKAKATREQKKMEREKDAAAGASADGEVEELEEDDSSSGAEESETSGECSSGSEGEDSEGEGGSGRVEEGRRLVIRIPGGRVQKA